MRKLLALFLFALPLRAQTPLALQNPSFELNASAVLNGTSWEVGQVPGWTVTGSGGLWQPPTQFSALPDGKTVLFLNGASATQDLGVSAAACGAACTVSVFVGNRNDGPSSSYTVSLSAGSTNLCTMVGANSAIPPGTFAAKSLDCPMPSAVPSGNLVVSLSAAGAQVQFDLVAVSSAIAAQSVNLTLSGALQWDDGTPIAGTVQVQEQEVPSQNWMNLATFTPDGNGQVSGVVSVSTNFADAPWFLFTLREANGNVVGVVEQSAPGMMFKGVHSVTGFKLVVNKASCAATQCVLGPGSTFGTLGP